MDFDALEMRISKCEEDIKALYKKTNAGAIAQAKIEEKLDNVLMELGRVRESLEALKERPGKKWDKLIYAIIGALGAALISILLNGGIS